MKKETNSQRMIGNQNARKHPKVEKLELGVGQRVWFSIPVNGTITKVKEGFGYEIEVDKTEQNGTFAFFTDDDVKPL